MLQNKIEDRYGNELTVESEVFVADRFFWTKLEGVVK